SHSRNRWRSKRFTGAMETLHPPKAKPNARGNTPCLYGRNPHSLIARPPASAFAEYVFPRPHRPSSMRPTLMRKTALSLLLASLACAGRADEIKIGEYASLTGKEAAFGQSSHKGTVLAIEEINAAGGVLGRKIDLVTEDDQSKPGEPSTAVRKLIARDKVVAILGEVASSRSLEAAPVCEASRIPMISPSSTNPKVTQIGRYIFRVCFVDPFQGTVLAKFAKDTLHAHRVALLTSVSSAYSVGLARFFRDRFTADGGEIALEAKYSE